MFNFKVFTVKGREFTCTYNKRRNPFNPWGDINDTVSVCSAPGFWCERTVRTDDSGREFFTWNGKVVYIDELVDKEM